MKMDEPEFPLRQRFHFHNCTLEGLEEAKKGDMSEHGNPSLDFDPAEYPPQRGDDSKESKLVDPNSPLFKYDVRGYRLPIDEQGKWLRTTGNWRPSCYSTAEWNRLSKVEKDVLRVVYKDYQKGPPQRGWWPCG